MYGFARAHSICFSLSLVHPTTSFRLNFLWHSELTHEKHTLELMGFFPSWPGLLLSLSQWDHDLYWSAGSLGLVFLVFLSELSGAFNFRQTHCFFSPRMALPRHLQRCAAAEEVLQGDKSSTNELSTHYTMHRRLAPWLSFQYNSHLFLEQ